MKPDLTELEIMSDVGSAGDRPLSEDLATDGVTKNIAWRNDIALPPEAEDLICNLPPDVAQRCRESGRIIFRAVRKTTVGQIEIGHELTLRKKELDHGLFGPYCDALGVEERHAQRCMQVAEHFWNVRELVSVLSFSVLVALTVKAVPPQVRDDLLKKLEAGQRPTSSSIWSMIDEATRKNSARSGTDGEKTGASVASAKPSDGQTSSESEDKGVERSGDMPTAGHDNARPMTETPMDPQRAAPLAVHAQSVVRSEDPSPSHDEQPSTLAAEQHKSETPERSGAESAVRMFCELEHEWKLKFWQDFRNADEAEFVRLLRQRCEQEFGTSETDTLPAAA